MMVQRQEHHPMPMAFGITRNGLSSLLLLQERCVVKILGSFRIWPCYSSFVSKIETIFRGSALRVLIQAITIWKSDISGQDSYAEIVTKPSMGLDTSHRLRNRSRNTQIAARNIHYHGGIQKEDQPEDEIQ
jgi:hypothetical protein